MKTRVKDRLESVKLKWPNLNHNIVLEKTNVEELSRLQESYIITLVDKAVNNFAFQCKKFYFLQGGKDLGLNNLQTSTTYRIDIRDKVTI